MGDPYDRNTNFGSWDKLGSRYYRKFEVYCMKWGSSIDISSSTVVAAPHGGPLGLFLLSSLLTYSILCIYALLFSLFVLPFFLF